MFATLTTSLYCHQRPLLAGFYIRRPNEWHVDAHIVSNSNPLTESRCRQLDADDVNMSSRMHFRAPQTALAFVLATDALMSFEKNPDNTFASVCAASERNVIRQDYARGAWASWCAQRRMSPSAHNSNLKPSRALKCDDFMRLVHVSVSVRIRLTCDEGAIRNGWRNVARSTRGTSEQWCGRLLTATPRCRRRTHFMQPIGCRVVTRGDANR